MAAKPTIRRHWFPLLLLLFLVALGIWARLSRVEPGAPAGSAGEWTVVESCEFMPGRYHDGDSFHVLAGRKEYVFRLYFVDAPETDRRFGRAAEQAEYWGLSEEDVLGAGGEAAELARRLLEEGDVTVATKWRKTGGGSSMPRYYAVVTAGGRDLAQELVDSGLARVRGAKADLPDGTLAEDVERSLREAEARAKARGAGAWGRREGGL
ncbi:thermonuclease family protein [Verrucomicrobiota bacterium]